MQIFNKSIFTKFWTQRGGSENFQNMELILILPRESRQGSFLLIAADNPRPADLIKIVRRVALPHD